MLDAVVGFVVRVFLSAAEWIYMRNPEPGYDWTTGRRRLGYRFTWQLGRVLYWAPLIAIAALVIYVVYFTDAGTRI